MNSILAVLLIPVLAAVSLVVPAFSNPGGVLALLATRRQRYEHRHRLMNRRWRPKGRSAQRSSRISAHLHAMVERADRHRCVGCGARWVKGTKRFPVDHMVPWIMGGLTALWNCAALCRSCNATKSCYWVSPSGTEYYRGRRKPPPRARLILAAELDARRSVLRWFRAYGLLPAW